MPKKKDSTKKPTTPQAPKPVEKIEAQAEAEGFSYNSPPEKTPKEDKNATNEQVEADLGDETMPENEQSEERVNREAESELPGGRPAERLREFIDQRYPEGVPYSPLPEDNSEEADKDISNNSTTTIKSKT